MNSHIRTFLIDSTYFLANNHSLFESKIKLDVLSLKILNNYDFNHLKACCRLLNELYENGSYEQLQLDYASDNLIEQVHINQLISLKRLVKLTMNLPSRFTLSALVNLEELCVRNTDNIEDWMGLPNSLVNLQRIELYFASADDIFMFMPGSKIKFNKNRLVEGWTTLQRKYPCTQYSSSE